MTATPDCEPAGFNTVQLDALSELINMGCGRAAESLAIMTGAPIELSAPLIKPLSRTALAAELRTLAGEEILAIEQEAHGAFAAHGLLIFPEAAKPVLLRALIRGLLDPDSIPNLGEETLIELGNIVLNAVIGVFAEQLGTRLVTSLPTLLATGAEDLAARFREPQREVLLVEVQCRLAAVEVTGYLLLLLDIVSLEAFRDALADLVARS